MSTPPNLSVLSAELILVAAILAGCASPEPRYYTLAQAAVINTATAPTVIRSKDPALIEISPVHVPEGLNRTNLLLDMGGGRLRLMELDRWSAPLPDELRDALSQRLQTSLGAVDTYHQGTSAAAPSYRVTAEVVRMNAELGGNADAIINWIVQRLPDRKVTSGRTQVTLPTPGGVGSVVAAYQHIVIDAADDIATAIRELQQVSPAASETETPFARYNQYHAPPEKRGIP
ncbi:hypothetical protein SAMN04515620_10119 [Collimonas sp. OK607]|uniref:PqiC family protein n=1 Tax=Collimonas sp. OK607 TaxID=1798194 RepID=UPI0008E8AA07|nr:PqiC family protein [Collimonas sp. OK607]SFA68816.1 hypothetical protein SAMN04515620_10119 [Collimonas sp. OK607]